MSTKNEIPGLEEAEVTTLIEALSRGKMPEPKHLSRTVFAPLQVVAVYQLRAEHFTAVGCKALAAFAEEKGTIPLLLLLSTDPSGGCHSMVSVAKTHDAAIDAFEDMARKIKTFDAHWTRAQLAEGSLTFDAIRDKYTSLGGDPRDLDQYEEIIRRVEKPEDDGEGWKRA